MAVNQAPAPGGRQASRCGRRCLGRAGSRKIQDTDWASILPDSDFLAGGVALSVPAESARPQLRAQVLAGGEKRDVRSGRVLSDGKGRKAPVVTGKGAANETAQGSAHVGVA